MFEEHDVVRLREARAEDGLSAGAEGTVVHVFREPHLAFEVEFADEEGQTIAMVPLCPEQLELVWSACSAHRVEQRAA